MLQPYGIQYVTNGGQCPNPADHQHVFVSRFDIWHERSIRLTNRQITGKTKTKTKNEKMMKTTMKLELKTNWKTKTKTKKINQNENHM